jgi:hypothetical protein
MIANGPRRIRMADRNWRFGWAVNIYLSRYAKLLQVFLIEELT